MFVLRTCLFLIPVLAGDVTPSLSSHFREETPASPALDKKQNSLSFPRNTKYHKNLRAHKHTAPDTVPEDAVKNGYTRVVTNASGSTDAAVYLNDADHLRSTSLLDQTPPNVDEIFFSEENMPTSERLPLISEEEATEESDGGLDGEESKARKKEQPVADVGKDAPENASVDAWNDDDEAAEESDVVHLGGEESKAQKKEQKVAGVSNKAPGNAAVGLRNGDGESKKEGDVAQVSEEESNVQKKEEIAAVYTEAPAYAAAVSARGGDEKSATLQDIVKGIQGTRLHGMQFHLKVYNRVKEFSSSVYEETMHSLPTRATQISASVAFSFAFFCLCLCVYFFKNCRQLEDSALTIIYVLTFGCAIVSAKCAFVSVHTCPVLCALLQSLAMAAAWLGMRQLEGKDQCWNEEDVKNLIIQCWPYGVCVGASLVLINVAICVATLLLFSPLSKCFLTAIVKNEDINANVLGCALVGFLGCTVVILTGRDVGLPVAICMLSIMLSNLGKYVRPPGRDHRFDVSILLSSGFAFLVWIFTGNHEIGVLSMHPYLLVTLSCFATAIYVGSQITLKKTAACHSAQLGCCGLLFICSHFVLLEPVAFLQVLGIIVVLAANLWFRSISAARNTARHKEIAVAKDQLL
eukprot:GEMP01017253.1.p1 GENE.GEMP01017253.1~~GEMP01017253.1.p1  ORF type:complete len:635 (+),score=139.28 GEMP01017253.1:255-2159(+)